MSTERVDTIVVGAGMAGLLAARVAAAGGATVAVVDPQPPGGRARTDERQGYRWNRGPHALYHGGAAERLLQQFGVPLAGGAPAGGYFGSLGGIVEPLPVGPASLVRSHLLSTRGKASLARSRAKLLAADPSTLGGVSFDEWLDGLRITADAAALQRMLARVGTYCCATDIAAADMVVGQMQQAMRAGVRYLDGGWQVLVDALAAGLDVRRGTAVSVGRDGGDVVAVLDDGRQLVGRTAVVAVATPDAAAALTGRALFDTGPAIEAACLDLATDRPASRPLLFGIDQPLYLSDHGAVARLAPAGGSVVHVARYLRPGEEHDPAATRAELEHHAALAGIGPADIVDGRYLHRMTVAGALATVEHGGLAGRPGVADSGLDGVFLAGDWVGREGHLLDASAASAEAAAQAALSLLATGKLVGR